MATSAIILILISAFMHAGWNLLGKKSDPNLAFFLLANLAGCLILLLPVAIYYSDMLQFLDKRTFWLACIAGLFLSVNYWGLSRAYRFGHISVTYPIARSFPIIFVTVIMLMAGFTELLNSAFLFGASVILLGSIILPMNHFTDFKLSNYTNQATWYALLAAVGTAGYSIVDSKSISGLGFLIPEQQDIIPMTLIYALIEALFASAWMAMVLSYNEKTRLSVIIMLKTKLKSVVITGIGIHMTYTLVLISMSMVENVSYIVAFRQVSIPIGVILGISLMGEPGTFPKLLGVCLMFLGVILVSIG